MIKPINGHVLIEPLVHDSFISQGKETYEEIGVVVDYHNSEYLETHTTSFINPMSGIRKGTKVYFDSWLAAKYPKNEKEYYWLVKYEDVRAIDNDALPQEQPVSE